MIPGSRRAAAMWFSASRSCTFSRWHRSQENRNGFQTARASHTLFVEMGTEREVAVAPRRISQSLQQCLA